MNIQEIIKKAENENTQIREFKKQQRIYLEIKDSDFAKLFNIQANSILVRKNQDKQFIYDEHNKIIIRQLYLWITNNSFNGNSQKGILLLGNIGCGKTLILESFVRVYNLFAESKNKISIQDSRQLFYHITKYEISNYISHPLFIDDLGKEPLEHTHFGYTRQPMIELLSERHRKGVLTFATGNYTLDDYENTIYNKTITDRLKELFNIMILKGDSKR